MKVNPRQLITNRFELHDLLGRGGMGDVYRATDKQTGETVAVKALNPEVLERDPSLLERFVREGEALRQLNHPNIVHMVAAVEEEGRHYLVMEFVEGGSLRDLLTSRGSLPANEVVTIALEVADALTRAHHLKIIHRDLKPANVLLAKDGTPRLADFGIAHIQESSHITQTGILVGTVDYLSPEVCQGEMPDEHSDIWSFGVMLFQMLSGRLPFEGKSLTAKITAILHRPIPDLNLLAPKAPDALVDLVDRMLEKDPQQRIPSVRLVGAELEAMLKGRQPVTPSRRSKEERRFETPTPSLQKAKHNLPTQPTLFVGRQAELIELARLLNEPAVRLVTILGAGGMGKTRLALEASVAQLDNYPNGVYFVSLAPLDSIDAIVPAIAQALGFSFYAGGEPRQQLLDYLREKSMLLILDNFEHLLAGVDLVSEILNTAVKVKIISTSRARLNVQGEQLFRLGGMDFPDWGTLTNAMEYSAVKLFMQSACRVRPDFELTPDKLKHIVRICKLVEGMPLGILLAASWVEMLSPEEIATEIEKSLDFLETEQRDLPERQHSMRAIFDYSWNLLTPKEQEVFKKLSVFRGGFTREAAHYVADASLRESMALVDKSLVYRLPTGRYNVHELLRQYARDKLLKSGESGQIQMRHLDFFLQLAEVAEPNLRGPEQHDWLERLDLEHDNLRAALDWSVNQNVEAGLRLAGMLAQFWDMRRYWKEGLACLSNLLSQPQAMDKSPVCANALYGAGLIADSLGEFKVSREYLERAIEIAREHKQAGKRLLALALCMLSTRLLDQKKSQLAQTLYDEGWTIAQELDDQWLIARMLYEKGTWLTGRRDYETARATFEKSKSLFRSLGDRRWESVTSYYHARVNLSRQDYEKARLEFERGLPFCYETMDRVGIWTRLNGLGEIARSEGNYAQAKDYHSQGYALAQEMGRKLAINISAGNLGAVALRECDLARARELFSKELRLAMEMEQGYLYALWDFAWLATLQKHMKRATILLAAAKALETESDMIKINPADEAEYDHYLHLIRAQLDDAEFNTAWAEGAALTLEQAVELALSDEP